ncbi:hypothetical protein Zmor_008294 [Zophobas morio]|uniref:Uncharacterized protein n=1 Tax=Zophobas morio TaxID=2755281 RepID=A0AA38IYJ9_9CUCU|nr:hypothetical protein Zmor_008294 [Zophobas morio]
MVISLATAVVTGCTYVVSHDFDQLVYVFPLCEEYVPELKFIIVCGFRCSTIIFFCFATISPSHYIVYGLLLFKLEENIILHSLKNINQNYDDQDELDQESHNIIKERLLFCLKRHINFRSATVKILKKTENLVFPLQLAGVLYFISIVVNSITLEGTASKLLYWRLFSITLTAFVTLVGVTVHGQKIEDLSDNILDCLVSIKWYHWNDANKKLYLMFLKNSLKPFKIKFTENISVNYRMGVEILKTFFSFISVVRQLQNKKN